MQEQALARPVTAKKLGLTAGEGWVRVRVLTCVRIEGFAFSLTQTLSRCDFSVFFVT